MARISLTLSAIVCLSLSALPARGDFTPVAAAPPAGEPLISTILDTVYGGTFLGASNGAASYTNGAITATRAQDFLHGGPLNLLTGLPGSTDDQLWTDGVTTVTAEAKFAAQTQAFGFTDGSGYHELFDTFVAGSVTGPFTISGDFRWNRSDSDGGVGPGNRAWSSVESDNLDVRDHMITYQITGLGGIDTVWLLLWDDQDATQVNPDFDFNDLAVEIRASEGVRVIPVPAPILLGVVGFGLTGWFRRRIA